MVAKPRSVVVVSHAGVLATNRGVYEALAGGGTDVELVVPARWRNEYRPGGFVADPPGALDGHLHPTRVLAVGRPQRHGYLARTGAVLRRLGAEVLLVEEEPFSVAARQWSRAARRASVPYGVQVAETLDLDLPAPVARWRHGVLAHAAFVLARSPGAAELARRWGARIEPDVVPHDVADVDEVAAPTGPFTVAYVGRLVAEKGLDDLLAAVASLDDVHLLVAGAGPLEGDVRRAGALVELLGAVDHDRVGDVYARAHVTCVPSRATRGWVEQFGRVVVESLVRGVPVVASATGELPWVLSVTGGGVLVAERDPAALAAALAALRDDPSGARALGRAGREGVRGSFTTPVVAGALRAVLDRVRSRSR
ncbi:MAG TPA: glycosyltransferase [Acidimicrobiales bacterium]|jgi:glycosyltransferase involved in cell wall biosynthesis|nr:glycosyltransferase [Acidimicrobiales bacterium]